jgi:tetratricopeptide (TPR) repeat protein
MHIQTARSASITLILLLPFLAAGCVDMSCAETPIGIAAMSDKSAEWHWQRRDNEQDLRTAIALFEQEFARRPSVELCNTLCRAYYLLSDYYLEDDPEAQAPLHAKAFHCAIAGLKLQENVAALLGDAECPSVEAISLVNLEHAGPLFWWAAHFGRWVEQKNLVVQLMYKSRFLAALERVQSLDDKIFGASLYRTWGAYYAYRGDMEKARQNFEYALELVPAMTVTRIMYAKECGLRWGNRELFTEQLKLVLEAPEPDIAEIQPEYRMDRARAARLLKRADELFK